MAARKKTTRKRTTSKKKSSTRKSTPKRTVQKKSSVVTHKDKDPEFMVQVHDPKMIRKDALESLREIIVFMQGYEKFRQIQDEKVALFTKLKSDVRELNTLMDHKLRRLLPKGKLRSVTKEQKVQEDQTSDLVETVEIEEKPITKKKRPMVFDDELDEEDQMPQVETVPEKPQRTELDELEDQLKDIEGQLRGLN